MIQAHELWLRIAEESTMPVLPLCTLFVEPTWYWPVDMQIRLTGVRAIDARSRGKMRPGADVSQHTNSLGPRWSCTSCSFRQGISNLEPPIVDVNQVESSVDTVKSE